MEVSEEEIEIDSNYNFNQSNSLTVRNSILGTSKSETILQME